jgi:hypothetical protein
LMHIETGGRTDGMVRTALLLVKAGTGRRRLSAMKRARELVGKDAGLLELPAETAREIIRRQSYIVDFEPERALSTLPVLLKSREDRRITLALLDRLEGEMEANDEQRELLGRIRRLLSANASEEEATAKASVLTLAEKPSTGRRAASIGQGSTHRSRKPRRVRQTSERSVR